MTQTLLFFDTETGGLDPRKHSLLSIGLVVGDGPKVVNSLEILIRHEPFVVSAGGMKVIRWQLVLKQAQRELMRLVHPRAALPVKFGDKVVPGRVLAAAFRPAHHATSRGRRWTSASPAQSGRTALRVLRRIIHRARVPRPPLISLAPCLADHALGRRTNLVPPRAFPLSRLISSSTESATLEAHLCAEASRARRRRNGSRAMYTGRPRTICTGP